MKYNYNVATTNLETAIANGKAAIWSRDYWLGLMVCGEAEAAEGQTAEAMAEKAAKYLRDRRFKDIKAEAKACFKYGRLAAEEPHYSHLGFDSASTLYVVIKGLKLSEMDDVTAEKVMGEFVAKHDVANMTQAEAKACFKKAEAKAEAKAKKLTKAEKAEAEKAEAEAAESLTGALVCELARLLETDEKAEAGLAILRLVGRDDVVLRYFDLKAAKEAKAKAEAEEAKKAEAKAAEAKAEAEAAKKKAAEAEKAAKKAAEKAKKAAEAAEAAKSGSAAEYIAKAAKAAEAKAEAAEYIEAAKAEAKKAAEKAEAAEAAAKAAKAA